MNPSALLIGQRLLVWMVAIAVSMESLAQTVVALMHGSAEDAIVWVVTWMVIIICGHQAERIKWFLEQS